MHLPIVSKSPAGAWRWVLGGAFVGLILAIIALHVARPEYEAALEVGSATDRSEGSGALGSILPNLSALMSQFQLGSTDTELNWFLEVLTSQDVINAAQRQQNIFQYAFPAQWDKDTQTWHPANGIGSRLKRVFNWILGAPSWHPPNAGTFQGFLLDSMTVSKVESSGLYRIALRFRDREEARQILSLLVANADQHLRQISLRRYSAYVNYLQKKAAGEQIVENRTSLAQFLTAYQIRQMLATVDTPFAAEVVSALHVTVDPVSPQRNLWVIIGILLGGVAGFGAAYWYARRQSAADLP